MYFNYQSKTTPARCYQAGGIDTMSIILYICYGTC
jgi:hypothetical protein